MQQISSSYTLPNGSVLIDRIARSNSFSLKNITGTYFRFFKKPENKIKFSYRQKYEEPVCEEEQ